MLVVGRLANALLCQTSFVNLTIFGGFAKDLPARLSATGAGKRSHPDAVVGESVEAVQLQHFAFGLFGPQLATRLCKEKYRVKVSETKLCPSYFLRVPKE